MDKEIKSLTALRGLAALGVLAFHAGVAIPGYLCVDLFFMLSGFVLMHAYGERFAGAVSGRLYGAFLRARLARIYPVHLLTLLMLLPLYGRGPTFSLVALVHNLFLTQGPWLGTESWNYGAWSISAEWHAYLLFPFLAITIGARGRRAIVSIAILSLAAVIAIVTLNGSPNIACTPAVLLRCLPEFVLGMALYRLYRDGWVPRVLGGDRASIAIVLALAAWVAWGGTLADPAIRCLLPLALLACAMNGARAARLLNSRPLRFIGDISYPLYMVQMVSQFLLLEFWPDSGSLHGVAFVALSVALAIPISRFVEYPARNWLRAGKIVGWSRDGRRHGITLAARFRRWEPCAETTAPAGTVPSR